ncbi:HXXEE domain-containing protein [Clostridium sp. 1001271B_151109_B4]|uniref:HXXEE domain-containing protein n=1 Tax=Clostridium sp. 1001271B_151109_B4 TaxID=2787148 RepID=UPI0018AA5830|nr:HXXEE domain-containing protein [Clostridium sp. 1001271B_151109_B4]
MKKSIKSWYYISVYIASMFALILAVGEWTLREKTLLISLVFIFLHFFEEFGFPGGFPWIGMKVEKNINDTNPKNWPFNQIAAMFGNVWFAVVVYLLPLFLPKVRFLTLAVILFAFAEVLMHLIVFNIALKSWYNPGLFTSIFGLLPVSVFYLSKTFGMHIYTGTDFIIALVWIVFNYWVAFRSPIFKRLIKMPDYEFTTEEVYRAKKYIDKFK